MFAKALFGRAPRTTANINSPVLLRPLSTNAFSRTLIGNTVGNGCQPLVGRTPRWQLNHGGMKSTWLRPALIHTQTKINSPAAVTAAKEEEAFIEDVSEPPKRRFDSVTAINPKTQNAIARVFGYTEMSKVQEAVLTQLPLSQDLLVKAKTGTGKTLAFLIPAIEASLQAMTTAGPKGGRQCSILIISPTRELAQQIAEEARKLLKFYPTVVHCLVGGEPKGPQIRRLMNSRVDVIVGTPGRLNDMLESVREFEHQTRDVKVLILDEADQLLDMGFSDEVRRITNTLSPPEARQTLLFSATVSPQIKKIAAQSMRPDYLFIDTVDPNDVNTNLQTKQSYVVAPYPEQLSLIRNIIEQRVRNNGKVMVFLPTTKSTMLYSELFRNMLPNWIDEDDDERPMYYNKRTRRSMNIPPQAPGPKIFELHSKKSQQQRSRISDQFRRARSGILFTSDVSARGVDYPGVSLVLQIGVPSSREQYIHRLGRTGRAGKDGEGVIILAPFEETFIRQQISDLPIQKAAIDTFQITPQHKEEVQNVLSKVAEEGGHELFRDAYMAYLGYYTGRISDLKLPRRDTLTHASHFIKAFGVEEVPYLSSNMLTRMGFTGGNGDDGRSFDRNRRGGRSGSFDRGGYGGYGRRDSSGDRFSGGRDGRDGMERRSSGARPWEQDQGRRDEGRGGRSRDREWEDRRGWDDKRGDDRRGERRAKECF
ncbi:P-loop containing nucleoside triphosphate hydrolase protein [Endogone sp. FLAS-F59071]|nr:P-loop containing nucleoside triphosphate hydrolase protein [Endogone sp. FLAS-F59071]|eukprot:RUS16159.1 P-loop containing nucleoside triphosphate hydrolase protein [Endogone sp. FLAS-F59071]